MTPREPDRYEEKARELVRRNWIDYTESTVKHVAAALRAEADAALERAAREAEALSSNYDKERAEIADGIAEAIRALASPAAAPAAATITGPRTPPSDLEVMPSFREPSDPVAPSLLPRVLAALEKRGQWPNLAAELRRYIADVEADSGR